MCADSNASAHCKTTQSDFSLLELSLHPVPPLLLQLHPILCPSRVSPDPSSQWHNTAKYRSKEGYSPNFNNLD
ncbi:hypothetical protein CRENBAI_012333 [Crenichthys baileyi]|uniref:Uncharacterized protein n=1 Tax=Crenichthys baileyi TaxID=28760 RepID=A0AAV9S6F0_9TELE